MTHLVKLTALDVNGRSPYQWSDGAVTWMNDAERDEVAGGVQ